MISNQGKAIAILPAPRKTARRLKRNFVILPSLLGGQILKRSGLREVEQQLLDVEPRRFERAIQLLLQASVFLTRIVQGAPVPVLDPMLHEALLNLRGVCKLLSDLDRPGHVLGCAGQLPAGVDRHVVLGSPVLTDRVVVLERKPDRVDETMAA